jgi:hypothetical protein
LTEINAGTAGGCHAVPKNREGFSTMRWNQAIVYVAGALMFLGVALSVIEPRSDHFRCRADGAVAVDSAFIVPPRAV